MSLTEDEQQLFNYMKIVSVSSVEETENIYKEILSSIADNSTRQLGAALDSLNSVIRNYGLEIVQVVDEYSMKPVHCLISINNNKSVAQKVMFYDKATCALLSKIIEECITSDNGWVREITCLNASTSVKVSKINLQSSLEKLIKDKWLVSKNGEVSLGVRCQLEFEHAIKKQYPNYVKCCALCQMFVIQGVTCPECECHIHNHCMKKYCDVNKLSLTCRICPICKEGSRDKNTDDSMECDEEGSRPPVKRLKESQ